MDYRIKLFAKILARKKVKTWLTNEDWLKSRVEKQINILPNITTFGADKDLKLKKSLGEGLFRLA